MKFHFCQNDSNETIPIMSFKRTCALNAISNEPALIHFASGKFCSHENFMPAWNFIWVKMTDMKSIPVWVSFRLNSRKHKWRADWTPKWDFQPKWNPIPIWNHFASHVNVLLSRLTSLCCAPWTGQYNSPSVQCVLVYPCFTNVD